MSYSSFIIHHSSLVSRRSLRLGDLAVTVTVENPLTLHGRRSPQPQGQTRRIALSRHPQDHRVESRLPRNAACDIDSAVRSDNPAAAQLDSAPLLRLFPVVPFSPRVQR